MFNISKYLEKFKKNLESGEILNNIIKETIKKHTNIDLKIGEFELKNNVIVLKTTPSVKNKIFIFNEDIKREILNNSGLKNLEIR